MNDRKPQRIPKDEVKREPPHRLYMTFANIRSAALETARVILDECGERTPADVKRFLDKCAKETA
jgi:hypothetical protein